MRQNKQRHPASEALIELREALGMSQQDFAVTELKSALNTVGRYETTNPPRGDTLLRLAEIAERRSLPKIAARFRRLHSDQLLSDTGLKNALSIDPQTGKGWLLLKLDSREELDDAIDLFQKHRKSHPDAEWTEYIKSLGDKKKKAK
jgi:transcriptional regulator with XRE-family HTH domain